MRSSDDETTTADAELVREARNGRQSAYAELARRWSARVLAVCHARVGRRDAEDLAQETLLRGLRGLHTLDAPEKFGAWLTAIARRVCLDWRKGKQNSQVPLTQLSGDGRTENILRDDRTGPAQNAERADELKRLMDEVESLPEEYREVLLLFYYDKLTYRELADMLGVSTATINARLTRARNKLRERLSQLRR